MSIPSEVMTYLDELGLNYKKREGTLAITVISVPFPVETVLACDDDTEVLTWTATLLKGNKKRDTFGRLVKGRGLARAFQTLGQTLSFGELLVDPEFGPILRARWPLNAVNLASLRRAESLMRDAAIFALAVGCALDGGELEVSWDDILAFRHRRPDWQPEEAKAKARMLDSDSGNDAAAREQAEQKRHLDQRLLDVHNAIQKGDLRLARALAKAIGIATPTAI